MTDHNELARKILDVIPPSMGKIRITMRSFSPADMSVPQYRILGSIYRGRNLVGAIAKHQGVSQPAMSKMVDILVEKGLVRRAARSTDRRQVPLALTKQGEQLYQKVRNATRATFIQRLESLSETDRLELERGLAQLEKFFELNLMPTKKP